MWNQRTENPLVAQAAAELRRSSRAALRRITCDVRDGMLTLSGNVSSYYDKQIAQTLVQFRLPGVPIRNELEVSVCPPNGNETICVEESAFA